ncbi:Sodium/calcium exchanger MaX1 [Cytospora mali]|uniref:Sodium/calcium exchanger MaX1 n=1 Tax=Cytospora mali TaxID=578113 RepID=A0A194VJV3_CYTMA|nr:Sodium/calcium exchanger MaX1 [Valsa mali]
MGNFETFFNIAAFVAGLSLLERGAKLFVSSATTLATRLHLPEVLVAILIAGAEWEELAVVSLSLAQQRPALATGNIIGSSIANIFGAFGLGLVFSTGAWEGFDEMSKSASLGLLGLTSVVSLFALADILWHRIVAALLLIAFVAYVAAVLWTIWRGMFYTEQQEGEPEDIESGAAAHEHLDDASSSSSSSSSSNGHANGEHEEEGANESSSLLGIPKPKGGFSLKKFHHTLGPILQLICGFVALAISGFILSHTSTHLAESFSMSDGAFGATILSLATTLPEKFLAIVSGSQGHTGLLVADAVGSNAFLLTLCLGISSWSIASHDWHDHPEDGEPSFVNISRIEAWWLWASAVVLAVVVGVGGKAVLKVAGVRQMLGALMLMAYGGFLAIEFTILRGD